MPLTPEEFWQAIGEQLLIHRTRKRWNPIDVQRHGGPTYATVQSIEAGRIGTVESLNKHAAALGLSIVEIADVILQQQRARLSPEALQIVQAYESASIQGRAALLALAQALQERAAPASRIAQR